MTVIIYLLVQRDLDMTVMRVIQFPHISLSAQGYVNRDKPTHLSDCLIRIPSFCNHCEGHIHWWSVIFPKEWTENCNNMIHSAAKIHAMICTSAKNLYLIRCNVPFVFLSAWVIQKVTWGIAEERKEGEGNYQLINYPPWVTGQNEMVTFSRSSRL